MARLKPRTGTPRTTGTALALVLAACAPPQQGHEHREGAAALEDEVPSRSLTVWDQGFELFVEHPLPVAGEPLPFITHVTDLETAEPRRVGAIALYLDRAGATGEGSVFVDAAPRRDGVYVTELLVGEAGTWNIAVEIRDEDAVTRIDLPPTTAYADAAARDQAVLPDEPDGVTFLKEQAWRFSLRTEVAAVHGVQAEIRVPAYVALHPESRGEAATWVGGRLAAPPGGAFPSLGQRVEPGAVLAEVVPVLPDWERELLLADAAVEESRLELQQAEQEHERVVALHGRDARSDRELAESGFRREQARARHQAAAAVRDSWQRLLGGAPEASTEDGRSAPRFGVRAPVAGVVHRIHAPPGSLVREGQALVEILDTGRVLLEARVREDLLPQLRQAGAPRVLVAGAPGTGHQPLADHAPRLLLEEGRQDPADRTVGMVFEVANPDQALREGQLVELGFLVGGTREVLSIPHAAVIDVDGRAVAYVQRAGETFEVRSLTLGRRGRERVEVLEGLATGDRVVVQGAYAVRLATASGAVPEHSH